MTNKTLPEGYVCKACGSSEHSIHDCTKKIKKSKKEIEPLSSSGSKSGEADKPARSIRKEVCNLKIYISGLPFDTNKISLKSLLEAEGCQVRFIQLVMFDDNPNKCRGIAFVTLKDLDSVSKALQLSERQLGTKLLKVQTVKVEKNDYVKPMSNRTQTPRCYRCGENHDASTCSNPRICYRCKSKDHISSNCPLKIQKIDA